MDEQYEMTPMDGEAAAETMREESGTDSVPRRKTILELLAEFARAYESDEEDDYDDDVYYEIEDDDPPTAPEDVL